MTDFVGCLDFLTENEPEKMSQHENYDISEMREYFCTKFCSFVYNTTVQKCAALCCIYSTYTPN